MTLTTHTPIVRRAGRWLSPDFSIGTKARLMCPMEIGITMAVEDAVLHLLTLAHAAALAHAVAKAKQNVRQSSGCR